jgi:hypothetical protein
VRETIATRESRRCLSYADAVKPVLLPLLRRRGLPWASATLAVLLLHALIPQGFMPVPAADGFIGLCPDAAPMPAGMAMHHAHHGQRHTGIGDHGHSAPCVFAASAAYAGASQPHALTVAPATVLRLQAPSFTSHLSPAIVRAQRSRGPPAVVLI